MAIFVSWQRGTRWPASFLSKEATMSSAESNQLVHDALLTEHDACRYLSVSRSFLAKSRMDGALPNRTDGPPYHKIGRAIRYSIVDLDAWLAENRHDP